MYVETIFREIGNREEYLYWYSVQGEVEPSVDVRTEVVMILENVQAAMK